VDPLAWAAPAEQAGIISGSGSRSGFRLRQLPYPEKEWHVRKIDPPREGGSQGLPSRSYTGDTTVNELAQTLSDVARSLQDEPNLSHTLQGITEAAVQTVPGARYAGISEVQGRRTIVTRAATAEVVMKIDQVQYATRQGPCVDAIYKQQTFRLGDMFTEHRWPDFIEQTVGMGIRGMLSFQLYVVRDNLGALNLYSDTPDAFTDESEYVGLLFASHAAVAMIGAQQRQNKDQALLTRDLIGQAKGILMERHRLTADQAFLLMVEASQRTNTKLTEIAQRLTESGELG
jgi:GAF domain-containing protein